MQTQELHFKGAGELPLFARLWQPESPACALVVITHGHGEHIGRYTHVAESLRGRGFAVAAMDLRGHGRSQGPRGLVMDWEDLRKDLRSLVDQLRPQFADVPIILYGHSIGGTISLDFAIRYPAEFNGVIASAPVLGKPNIPAILFQISRVLSRIYPSFSMATQLDETSLSRDQEVVKSYLDDELVHSIGTARFGTELLKTVGWIQAHAAELTIPLLLIHGAQDRLVNPENSQRFFENAGAQDKTYMDLPDGFHEPHNDLDKDVVIKRVGDWILNHS
jgi:alpha-beta hydrolase superfamily lysophospholipase